MCMAKEQDVDMILLAGDLFHDNKPSRKSMYQVMRSLRMNCYGEKPCELEMLSDGSENFPGYVSKMCIFRCKIRGLWKSRAFDHVNYEDQDINVAIPCFSIHGNHDDPSGVRFQSSFLPSRIKPTYRRRKATMLLSISSRYLD